VLRLHWICHVILLLHTSIIIMPHNCVWLPVPVTARSKAWICGRSLAGIAGSNPARGMDVCLSWVVFCHVEDSATSWSLVQRSHTDWWVVCDLETSGMRRSWPVLCRSTTGKKKKIMCGLLTVIRKLCTLHSIDALQWCVDMDLCFV
jgi:hypothetical protein